MWEGGVKTPLGRRYPVCLEAGVAERKRKEEEEAERKRKDEESERKRKDEEAERKTKKKEEEKEYSKIMHLFCFWYWLFFHWGKSRLSLFDFH